MVSTARRAVVVLVLVVAMVVALSGMASAEPPDHASCFGKSESAVKGKPGPGTEISEVAQSGVTPVAAELVPPLQESTHAACHPQEP